ncbi:FAD-dependent oxidoreductase [Actinomadura rubrobrunea]
MLGRRDGAGRPGRDRHAEMIAPPRGRNRFTGDAPAVAVVGGGIAGLAAATVLAERGARVTLYEREEVLGGRVAGWPVPLADGSRATMTRGFHAFFRQYYNLRGLLRRVDAGLGMLTGLPDYPLQHVDGRSERFARVPKTPPWNALGFVALSPSFRWRDLSRMNPAAAGPLLDVRVPQIYERLDAVDAARFLTATGFPDAARHLAFEVFSRSFFADPERLSAAELALMFHIYFLGSAEGLLFDVVRDPFPQALWDPLGSYLDGLGVRVRPGTPVQQVRPLGGAGVEIVGEGAADRCDAVILALDVDGLRGVVARSPGLGDQQWRARVQRLRTAPPFLVSRLWLDRPPRPDRPAFLATSGFGTLDNVSLPDRWEGEAARWAARTGGSIVELHAYALPVTCDRRAEQDRLLAQLHRVYPETRRARIVDVRHLWREDCPLFAPGGYWDRPTVATPHPYVMLAGDLVRTDLPVALMERAATSGFLAANALLARWGVRGETLWTVPRAGRSRLLRTLAALVAPGGFDVVDAVQPGNRPVARSRQRRSA